MGGNRTEDIDVNKFLKNCQLTELAWYYSGNSNLSASGGK